MADVMAGGDSSGVISASRGAIAAKCEITNANYESPAFIRRRFASLFAIVEMLNISSLRRHDV